MTTSNRYPLPLPPDLKEAIRERAQAEDRSIAWWILNACRQALNGGDFASNRCARREPPVEPDALLWADQQPPGPATPPEGPAPGSGQRGPADLELQPPPLAPAPGGKKPPSGAKAVRAIWPDVQAAAARHGRQWQVLSPKRLEIMAARLAGEGGGDPQSLVRAVHGAVAYWRASNPTRDMTGHLVPETVYRASTFSKYLEAYSDPKTAPARRWEDMTPAEREEVKRQVAERERARTALERALAVR